MIARISSRSFYASMAAIAAVLVVSAVSVKAADEKSGEKPATKTESKEAKSDASAGESSSSTTSSTGSSSSESQPAAKKPKYPPYADFMREAEAVPGPSMIKMQRKGGTLYAELSPSQLNKDYIVVISIARGIGRGMLLAGMSWGFGDDWVWQFRKVDDY